MGKASNDLQYVKSQLNGVINRLTNITYELRSEFKGIGTENCASLIDEAIAKYRKALRLLENIDVSNINGAGNSI